MSQLIDTPHDRPGQLSRSQEWLSEDNSQDGREPEDVEEEQENEVDESRDQIYFLGTIALQT